MSTEFKKKLADMQAEIAANAARISAQATIDRYELMERIKADTKALVEKHTAANNAACVRMCSKLEHMKHSL
jgi:hypothetical protein